MFSHSKIVNYPLLANIHTQSTRTQLIANSDCGETIPECTAHSNLCTESDSKTQGTDISDEKILPKNFKENIEQFITVEYWENKSNIWKENGAFVYFNSTHWK